MQIFENISLKNHHTFGVDVKTRYFAEYKSVDELKLFLTSKLFRQNKMLHIGGGSNLLFLNDFDGIVLHSGIKGIQLLSSSETDVLVNVGAGEVWDDFVQYCVDKQWYGAENLSHIPGEIGASAVQNIGAYGVEVKDLIQTVYAIEVATGNEVIFENADCEYGYRESVFKGRSKGCYIITSVNFKLGCKPDYKLSYQHLQDEVLKSGVINLQNVRKTIIAVRQSKLPDPEILGNAGSFFMNPVVPKSHFLQLQDKYPEIPHYYVSETEEKIPAGWLIDRCGWKGRRIGNAAVHDKQALVIVNCGGATGREIAYLSEQIRENVRSEFGIELIPEVNFIA